MPRFKYSLVACARWEESEIVEWIEYHRSIGFDHFYIYSNDDDWQTLHRVLQPYILGPRAIVTYLYWPRVGEQIAMYVDFLRSLKLETEWACFLDIDEFIVLRGCDDIRQFMREFEPVSDCVYFNWLIFGNNGRKARDGRGTLSTLTRRSRGIDVHTKTIFRTQRIDARLVDEYKDLTSLPLTHFWNGYPIESFRMCNVLRDDVANYTDNFPHGALLYMSQQGVADRMIGKAFVAHFMFKSEDDFLRRAARGGFSNQIIWKERFDKGEHLAILEGLNEIDDPYLKQYWEAYMSNSVLFRSQPADFEQT